MNKTFDLNGLYAITDDSDHYRLLQKVESVLSAGKQTALLQYRDKTSSDTQKLRTAKALQALCQDYATPLIINDDIALARAVSAAGVHLGKEDGSVHDARLHLGDSAIIGVSCYNRLELALAAEQEGADYVAFGAFFSSPTKPDAPVASLDLLIEAKQRLSIPVCCIGGVTLENGRTLITAGADMLAVISGVFAAEDIAVATRAFGNLW